MSIHLFFIGGAADQERYYLAGPFHRVTIAKRRIAIRIRKALPHLKLHYHILGYNRIYHRADVAENVLAKISKNDVIFLIGHSLGGWNVAHLCRQLTDLGYRVAMLITLDPVGEGTLVWLGSNIHRTPEPSPNAPFWLNVRSELPLKQCDFSDLIAQMGQRWQLTHEPTINEVVPVHHARAYALFNYRLSTGKSALDYLIEQLGLQAGENLAKIAK